MTDNAKPTSAAGRTVVLAVIGRAQGLKGEMRATSHTADPLAVADYGPLRAPDGRVFTIDAVRQQQGTTVILKLRGITTREQAESLAGVELSVAREALPPVDDEDDFYHADLVGLAAVDPAGEALGTVVAIHNFGAGDMLELRLAAGRQVFVPFTKAAVPVVSVSAGRLTIDPDAAGLNESDDADAPEPGAP
jgi:16S rRNA processing protein RimM